MLKKRISLIIFTFLSLLLLSVAYPLVVWGIAQLTPGHGKGRIAIHHGKTVGFQKVGQLFTDSVYFFGRPSAVSYNAAGSGGSNKGPSNPEYLKEVQARIDRFLIQHPYLQKQDVPAELVTASGSGLDPDISAEAALVQVKRVAKARHVPQELIRQLVMKHVEKPLLGAFGPGMVNVLELNVALRYQVAGIR